MSSSNGDKAPSKEARESFSKAFFAKLRKRHIIETLAAFIGGGWLLLEFVHWLLVDHYHFPERTIDITFVTILGALLCTLVWRWFSGREKPRKFKLELVLVLLVVLITVLLDLNFLLHLKGGEPETIPASQWKNSIAVLPFVDMSPQKDQEYFCDGMTEELINRLSNIKELKVPARTSAFVFKGKAEDIREIGRKLDVQTVLEGSIRKIDSQLRVTAQLVNITNGFHLWSDTYDRELKDVFSIQDEIASTIADKLKVTLLSDEKARLVKHSTENLEAYNFYILGRYFFYKGSTEEEINRAIGFFEQALAKDPGYAPAYGLQAACYSVLCVEGYLTPKEAYPKAKEAVEKALELDEELGEAHAVLGYLKMVSDWDLEGAEREFKRALKLSPGSVDVYIPYSIFLTISGRFDEGIAGFKRAAELDPATPGSYSYLGFGYYLAGLFDEAMAQYRKALVMDPSSLDEELYFAGIYALKGMYGEAVAQADKVRAALSAPEDAAILEMLGWVYAVSGRKEKALDLLNRMLDLRTRRYVDAYMIGEVYAGLGEKDKAFEWLNRAYEEHAGQMIFIKVGPWIKNLRSDPRYKELLKKMGWEK